LDLHVGKCKTTIFFRLCHPVEFSYMSRDVVFDRDESINSLGVIMNSKMSFAEHKNVTVGEVSAIPEV
jgi:hypothetical protein